MELRTNAFDGGVVVELEGELDIAAVPVAEAALRRVEEDQPPLLLMDMRGLGFIDSSGLRLVLAADRRARDDGRRFAIIPGPEPVQRVFRVTGVEQRLEQIAAVPGTPAV
jgi:anti-anti-sigma factor